ncbi:unnamed protein product [Mytilus coruscus]|uniref:Uncharacterized protein n=1 Tax=Mytilus coruscus TaxID=42192 RepID=A0A6J8CHU6_MYTCO|nr:unnamed protein product [Mytilus coruscus]
MEFSAGAIFGIVAGSIVFQGMVIVGIIVVCVSCLNSFGKESHAVYPSSAIRVQRIPQEPNTNNDLPHTSQSMERNSITPKAAPLETNSTTSVSRKMETDDPPQTCPQKEKNKTLKTGPQEETNNTPQGHRKETNDTLQPGHRKETNDMPGPKIETDNIQQADPPMKTNSMTGPEMEKRSMTGPLTKTNSMTDSNMKTNDTPRTSPSMETVSSTSPQMETNDSQQTGHPLETNSSMAQSQMETNETPETGPLMEKNSITLTAPCMETNDSNKTAIKIKTSDTASNTETNGITKTSVSLQNNDKISTDLFTEEESKTTDSKLTAHWRETNDTTPKKNILNNNAQTDPLLVTSDTTQETVSLAMHNTESISLDKTQNNSQMPAADTESSPMVYHNNKTITVQPLLTYDIITPTTSTINKTEEMMNGSQLATDDIKPTPIQTDNKSKDSTVPKMVTNQTTNSRTSMDSLNTTKTPATSPTLLSMQANDTTLNNVVHKTSSVVSIETNENVPTLPLVKI